MATGTIKGGVSPISQGGADATTAKAALEHLLGVSKLAAYYNASAGTVIDTALDGTMLVPLSSTLNESLYNALGDTFAYVVQFFYASVEATSPRVQLALPYTGTITKIAWRVHRSGWGNWHTIIADS